MSFVQFRTRKIKAIGLQRAKQIARNIYFEDRVTDDQLPELQVIDDFGGQYGPFVSHTFRREGTHIHCVNARGEPVASWDARRYAVKINAGRTEVKFERYDQAEQSARETVEGLCMPGFLVARFVYDIYSNEKLYSIKWDGSKLWSAIGNFDYEEVVP